MLNRFALLLLASTSLAPIALIYGVVCLSREGVASRSGWIALGTTVVLVVSALLLLFLVRKHGEVEPLKLSRAKSADREVVAFLVAYMLPLIVSTNKGTNLPGLVAFVLVLLVVLGRLHLVHVNPLLAICGYHFHEALTESGVTLMLITRSDDAKGSDQVRAIRVSSHVWIEATKEKQ